MTLGRCCVTMVAAPETADTAEGKVVFGERSVPARVASVSPAFRP